ncbi:MAG: energy-coupling factor transporter ATPase [Bacilli bacterium]|nr:energy-coupling factor transporter ATPase [Bacilli bacterium]
MNAIELKNLCFSYNSTSKILDDVSISISMGEHVSIVGHNGSGKSTLAKLIIGLIAPNKGSIFINGQELTRKTINTLRQQMALVFQNPDNQFIGATVEDDIAFGLENHLVPHNEMQQIIDEYAKKVGMINYLHNEPSKLSGGQKQRVAIAGALALSPKILILDESTSMLDPRGKREILEVVTKLKELDPELTIISITHDIEEAYLSDRIIVLGRGKVVFDGKPEEVFDNRDKFEELHLATPFIFEMKEKLKETGIKVKGNDIDSLVEAIWESK